MEENKIPIKNIIIIIISAVANFDLVFMICNGINNLTMGLSLAIAILSTLLYLAIWKLFYNFLSKLVFSPAFLYLFFGFLTTEIDIRTFDYFVNSLNMQWMIAEGLAFCIAVLFAFFVNKFFVFKSLYIEFSRVLKEFVSFISVRIMSHGVVFVGMLILIEIFLVKETIAKIFMSILGIIINYLCSKFLVFKKNEY